MFYVFASISASQITREREHVLQHHIIVSSLHHNWVNTDFVVILAIIRLLFHFFLILIWSMQFQWRSSENLLWIKLRKLIVFLHLCFFCWRVWTRNYFYYIGRWFVSGKKVYLFVFGLLSTTVKDFVLNRRLNSMISTRFVLMEPILENNWQYKLSYWLKAEHLKMNNDSHKNNGHSPLAKPMILC